MLLQVIIKSPLQKGGDLIVKITMYIKSKYIYFYKSGERYYILHTLRKGIFEIDKKLWTFLKTNSLIDIKKNSEINNKDLVDNGFLVSRGTDEDKEIKKEFYHRYDGNYLESLHIISTLSCNLRCKYCFVFAGVNTDKVCYKQMDFITAQKGIDLFFKDNTCPKPLVTFYGGEPLLNPELMFTCIDYIENKLKKKILKRIITNAVAATDEIAQKLKQYKVQVGVSLDGKKEAHNLNRLLANGTGSFDKTLKGYKVLVKNGIKPDILCTVGAHNLIDLENHLDYIISLKPNAVALNFPRELTKKGVSGLEKEITPQILLDKFIVCLDKLYLAGIPELHFLKLAAGFIGNNTRCKACSGCGSQIALRADGKIGPCQAYAAVDKYFENIPSDKKDVANLRSFKKWKNIDVFKTPKCSRCNIMPICSDDCPFDRENRSGSLSSISSFHCLVRITMLDYLLGRIISKKNLHFDKRS